jgi:predicted permease
MQAIFAVTAPFFALVLLGWIAARSHVLPAAAIPGLNAYVLFFALPCLLFRFGASLPPGRLADPTLLGIYLLAALIVIAVTLALTLRRRGASDGVDLRDAAFGALVAAFPTPASWRAAARGPARRERRRSGDRRNSRGPGRHQHPVHLARAGARPARRPRRAAFPAPRRARLAAWRVDQPAAVGDRPRCRLLRPRPGTRRPVAQIVRMLGDSATPVALFTIGTVLWRAGRHAHTRTPVRHYLPVAIIKLLFHPALVFALGWAARWLGAPVSTFGLMVLTLTAALPSASNVSVLAERYGADNGRVARIIMASTILAFATFSVCAWLFGVGKTP